MLTAVSQIHSPAEEPVEMSLVDHRAESVGALFRDRVAATPDRPAYLYARPTPEGETWETVSWAQAKGAVYRIGAGLVALGVEPEQRVGIASNTRYEWAIVDLAVMCIGAATTSIYPSTIADDVAFIIADSAAVVVVAENAEQVEKLRGIRDAVPSVATVVVIDPEGVDLGSDGWVVSLADLDRLGGERLAAEPGVVDARIDATRADTLATIIYTSGTTGRPKGVRLLNGTWTYQGAATEAIGILHADDLQYLWLPLAHSFGKVLLTLPLQIGFATAIDGRVERIVDNLAVVRPTFMGAAPRIFEKAYGRIQLMMADEGGVKEALFHWAEGVGREASILREQGTRPRGLLALRLAVADRLVMAKIRERFGGRIRFFISGSAALNPDVARWFDAMGLQVAEGYGLTESSAASFVNRPTAYRYGTVGWPLPGCTVTIADDGEVLLGGPGIMEGYHNDPEATAVALDPDGRLHTGDIGELDERGFLRITDRKKDLFKTSGGKYVAPSAIEARFKGLCPYAGNIVVHGDRRHFVSALITLDPDAITAWAAAEGMAGASYSRIVTSDAARQLVQGYVDRLNAGLNRWERVRRFTILDRDLSVEEGELTPSLKLRRSVVSDKFKDALDAHYAD